MGKRDSKTGATAGTHDCRERVVGLLEEELTAAIRKHGLPADYHHGLGIMAEEIRELETEIFRKDERQNPHMIRAEAVQVAAMAIKIAMVAHDRAMKAVLG